MACIFCLQLSAPFVPQEHLIALMCSNVYSAMVDYISGKKVNKMSLLIRLVSVHDLFYLQLSPEGRGPSCNSKT